MNTKVVTRSKNVQPGVHIPETVEIILRKGGIHGLNQCCSLLTYQWMGVSRWYV